jgi:type IV fimbrial biogenesis protein FimT
MPGRTLRPRRVARGLTLIELVIALGVLALLISLTWPSFGEALARARLKSAAEDLALDLANARLESLRPGAGVQHVSVQSGTSWCYAVGPAPQGDCRGAAAGSYKVARAEDYPGVTMTTGANAAFDGTQPIAAITLTAEFASPHGHALRVNMTPLGRASICAPQQRVADYPRC